MEEKKEPYKVEEIEEKILEVAKQNEVSPEDVKEKLVRIKNEGYKIRGVWVAHRWMWIAVDQPTKMTWYGVVFSPIVPRGEWGSWYIWEPPLSIAIDIVEPVYRFRVKPEEIAKLRKKLGEIW